MRKIYFQNGILFYYGNPAGYLQGGTVVLDTLFNKTELVHYPKNIKEDWLALLKECEQMLIEDGIIHGDNQVEGLEELQEKQSGGMQMV